MKIRSDVSDLVQSKEIGSEFWDVPIGDQQNHIFPETAQWFLSGRNALVAIADELKNMGTIHTIAVPSWCCESMFVPFLRVGLKVRFYPVYWENGFVQEINTNCDAVLLMDYFGYAAGKCRLSNYNGIVIRDLTHSIFSKPQTEADYCFCSLRKWCGLWTGGCAWTGDGHQLAVMETENRSYITLRLEAMRQKEEYIYERRGDKGYLKLFGEAEDALEKIGVARAAERDVKLAKVLDVENLRKRRRTNAAVLRSAFPDWLFFSEMQDDDCPLFVPVHVPDGRRDQLRQYLIREAVFCPVHWPVSEYHKINKKTDYIYQNEISLVCDQRYSPTDMSRMVEIIKAFWKEL